MQKLVFVQNDTAPKVTFELLTGTNASEFVDLSEQGLQLDLVLGGSGTGVAQVIPMQVGALPLQGECVYDPSLGGTETAGDFAASIRITFGDGSIQTVLTPIVIQVLPGL